MGVELGLGDLVVPSVWKHLWKCFGFISQVDLSDLEHLVIYSGM